MSIKRKIIIAISSAIMLTALALLALKLFFPQLLSDEKSSLFTIMVVIIVIVLSLAAWLNASIVKPLSKLRRAAGEIREGNLEYELDTRSADEIGDLCRDFEQMRLTLKENAEDKTRADAENRMFISNISHDLKTPITAIKGYAGGIIDGVANTPEKLDKYIRTIYNKANDMDALIDELTLYSHIDMGKVPYVFKEIEISAFFQKYADDLRLDLEEQNIELTFYDALPQGVKVLGDEEHLRRVLNNIVSNSVKYMDKKKGLIAIRLRDEGDCVHIEIEDNGKGIEKDALPFIFDRFYRADSSRNSRTGGSGIGLSIVRKIVSDHGGSIRAVSEVGVGTVMHIRLKKYSEAEK